MAAAFSLAIATPTHRGLFTNAYVRSLWGLQRYCLSHSIDVELLTLANNSMIDRARNILTSHFLHRTQFSHLLFIDDDMGFYIDDLVRMFQWHHYDVVAAMCPHKGLDWQRVKDLIAARPDIDPAVLPHLAGKYTGMYNFLHSEKVDHTSLANPIPMKEIGTGIMLISRNCLERVINSGIPSAEITDNQGSLPIHEFFRQKVLDGRLIGEDFYFCHLVRQCGGEVYGCAWPTVIHSGQYEYSGNVQSITEVTGECP